MLRAAELDFIGHWPVYINREYLFVVVLHPQSRVRC
jgi:hypothetical protein